MELVNSYPLDQPAENDSVDLLNKVPPAVLCSMPVCQGPNAFLSWCSCSFSVFALFEARTKSGAALAFAHASLPTGLCHQDREMATAKAAAAAGVPYCFSTVATSSMQEIAQCGHSNTIFQLYVIRYKAASGSMWQGGHAMSVGGECKSWRALAPQQEVQSLRAEQKPSRIFHTKRVKDVCFLPSHSRAFACTGATRPPALLPMLSCPHMDCGVVEECHVCLPPPTSACAWRPPPLWSISAPQASACSTRGSRMRGSPFALPWAETSPCPPAGTGASWRSGCAPRRGWASRPSWSQWTRSDWCAACGVCVCVCVCVFVSKHAPQPAIAGRFGYWSAPGGAHHGLCVCVCPPPSACPCGHCDVPCCLCVCVCPAERARTSPCPRATPCLWVHLTILVCPFHLCRVGGKRMSGTASLYQRTCRCAASSCQCTCRCTAGSL